MKGKKGAPSPPSLTPHPCPLPTTYPLTLLQPDTPTLRRTWYKSRSVRGAGGGRPVSTMDLFTSRPLGQVSAGTLMSRARVMVDGCSWPRSRIPHSSCWAVSATRLTGGVMAAPLAVPAAGLQVMVVLYTCTGPHCSCRMMMSPPLLVPYTGSQGCIERGDQAAGSPSY